MLTLFAVSNPSGASSAGADPSGGNNPNWLDFLSGNNPNAPNPAPGAGGDRSRAGSGGGLGGVSGLGGKCKGDAARSRRRRVSTDAMGRRTAAELGVACTISTPSVPVCTFMTYARTLAAASSLYQKHTLCHFALVVLSNVIYSLFC